MLHEMTPSGQGAASPAAIAAQLASLVRERQVIGTSVKHRVAGILLPVPLANAKLSCNPHLVEPTIATAARLRHHGLLPVVLGADEAMDQTSSPPSLDALVVLADASPATITALYGSCHATVWADTMLWAPHGCIRRDELEAGRLVAQAARDAGYRRIAYVGADVGTNPHYSHTNRRRGVEGVAEAADMEVSLFECGAGDDDPSVFDALLDLLTPETALIAEDFYRLEWLTGQLLLTDRRPGRDFGVLCCDDSVRAKRYLGFITRARFDRFTVGRLAADMVAQMLRDPNDPPPSQLLRPTLIAGSTAPGPGNAADWPPVAA